MRKPRMAVALAAVAVTGPVAALCVLAAGPAAAATGPAGTAASPAAALAVQQRLAITSDKAAPAKANVRATGVLKAAGFAYPRQVSGSRATAWLIFKRGSLRLVTTRTSSSVSVPNPATCKFTEVVHGTYAIRGGARKYAGATGSGSYLTKIYGRLIRKHGSCTGDLASVWQGTWTWGTLHL
jgi:hypothetical protein